MKKLLTAAACFCFTLAGLAQNISSQLDSLVIAYAKVGKFNGSVLVAQNGSILLNKGYGLRDAASHSANNENTVYQIGSVTKQFTTAIIQKLQEEKKISVNDKLSKFFPDYPKGDSITVEQLMLHTSGIYSYTSDRNFMSTEVSKPQTRESMMALFKDRPLDFSPGTKWNYSNSAYSLLGYIIEIVTKKPWETVVREYIFKPVQMTHSGFDFTNLKRPEKATGYFVLNDVDTAKSPIVDSSVAYSAGSIYSTTGDLYRWHKALQNYSILPKALQEKAYTPVKNRYGYGWVIDSVEGKRKVAHSGGIHGFTSNFTRVPEDDIVVILLSNNSSPALGEMTTKILNALYKKPYTLPVARKAITLPEEKLKEYIGEYEINPQLKLAISVKDGNLWAQPTGQSPSTVFAEKEDFFFVKSPEVQLQFKRNEKNEVTGFTLFQGGATVECKKLGLRE
jgi:CubicO group peptidase (beta-lactamase class C family)